MTPGQNILNRSHYFTLWEVLILHNKSNRGRNIMPEGHYAIGVKIIITSELNRSIKFVLTTSLSSISGG